MFLTKKKKDQSWNQAPQGCAHVNLEGHGVSIYICVWERGRERDCLLASTQRLDVDGVVTWQNQRSHNEVMKFVAAGGL